MTSTVEAQQARGGTTISYIQKSQYGDTKYGTTLIVVEAAGSSFQCCGSRTSWHMSGYFGTLRDTYPVYDHNRWNGNPTHKPGPNDAELFDLKADFVCAYLNTTGVPYTLYGIATTSQIQLYRTNKRTMLHLLLEELGGTIIDERPNMVHGPNMMCMIAWCPKANLDLVKKYAVADKSQYTAHYIPAPNPFRKKKKPEVTPKFTEQDMTATLQAIMDEQWPFSAAPNYGPVKSVVVKPLRDAQGRFAKKKKEPA